MSELDPTLPSQLTAEMVKFTPSRGSWLVLTHVHVGLLKGQDTGQVTEANVAAVAIL